MWIELVKALFVGGAVGLIFAAAKLPIPAPPVLAGILGIVGIYLGATFYNYIMLLWTVN